DRVRKTDLVSTTSGKALGEVEHLSAIYGAFERAPERGPDRDRRTDAVHVRALDDPLGRPSRLLDRRVRVALVEGLGRGEGVVHLVEAGRGQPLVALLVQGEAGVDDVRLALDRRDDLFGAGHLRHARRVD